ncbi:hypothetical protein ACFV5G_19670 [Streptomyces sp. NPDC059766]|uniref:hypothetical protein n=1 Tax=Streptomyces sp. NPDC059766 TaxID=3346940 RepID=UPI0036610917
MPAALALLTAVLGVGLEQTVQWKYGAAGVIGLLLLSIGIRARNPTVSSIGAVMLAALVTRPAV